MKFETFKLLDCQTMPSHIKKIISDMQKDCIKSQYVEYEYENEILNEWFIENGLINGEKLLIKYW